MSSGQPGNLADPDRGRPVATIAIWGYGALLDAPPTGIEEELTYARTLFTAGGAETVAATMCNRDFTGRLQFPTGLVPRVAERLASMGYEVVATDHRRFGPRDAPDAAVLDRSAGAQRRFAVAVAENPLGRIEVKNFKDVVRRIAQFYRLFPEARIVVAVATRQRARGLRWMLANALGEPVGRQWGESRRFTSRITVSTFAYLNAFDPGEVDVLLLADAEEAVSETAKRQIPLLTVRVQRVYAFVPPNHRTSDAERLCLEAMAGRVIHRIGPAAAEVHVSVCPATLPLRVTGVEGLERKRRGLWHNARRNALVGRVAKALAARDLRKLGHLGVAVAGGAGQWLARLPEPRVLVLVESTEHADELRNNLPGWAVLSARPDHDAGEGQAADAACPRYGIVTLTYVANHRVAADVLVVADGVHGVAPHRGFPPLARACPQGRAMVVDFQDDFDEQAGRDSRRRSREYAAKGWTVTGANPAPPATPRATRPTYDGHAGKPPTCRPAVTDPAIPTRGNPTIAPTPTLSRMPATPTSQPVTGNNWASLPEDGPVPGTAPPTCSRSDDRHTDGKSAHNREEAATHT